MPEENEPTGFVGEEQNEIKSDDTKGTLDGEKEATQEILEAESPEKETPETGGEKEEQGEKKEVGFSDFLKARGIEVEGVEGEKKLETKKREVQPRTLDDIPEEDRPIFKNMSNDSFNKLKPIYLEHKRLKEENEQLKTKKPEGAASIYGHPEAFTLTKEYKAHSRDYTLADQIKTHWATQVARISRGEKWQDLDLDPKTGKLIISEPKESNAEAEVIAGDNLQMAREQLSEAKGKLKGFIDNYDSTYKNDLQVVTSAIDKYFPGYSAKDHPTQEIQKAVIEALPPSFRDNPVSQLLAMTAANNAILMGRLKKAQAEINKLKGIKDDTNAAQPRKGEFVNGKGGGGAVKFSDFAARRAQG